MKKIFFIILLFNISFSKTDNLKFETKINKKNEIIITVKRNNSIDILKKYNITLEDLKKLNLTLDDLEKIKEEEINSILNGEKNE